MAGKRNIETLIKNMAELPTLPSVFFTVSQMLSDPRTSAADVGQVVASDQVITSKILKLANSAFYGFAGKINTVSHAIAILGFSSTRSLLLTTSVLSTLNMKTSVEGFNLAAFWKHSAAVGAIAKLVANETYPHKQEEAFVAGLLHDIGKLILAICAPEDFAKCMSYAVNNGCLFLEAEEEILGVSHPKIANWVNEKWKLPDEISSVITNHHRKISMMDKYNVSIAIVQLADVLARGLQFGYACDNTIPIVDDEAWALLGMNSKKLDNVLAASHDAFQNSITFINAD